MGLLSVVKSAPLNENHSHLEFEPKKKPTQFKIINNFNQGGTFFTIHRQNFQFVLYKPIQLLPLYLILNNSNILIGDE